MALPSEALDLVKRFEGYLRQLNDGTGRVAPYLCPARVPTIGWGTTYYPGGRKVTMADPPIDRERATECLAHELQANERDVDRLTTARLHPLSRGAVVSFVYNCGSGAYRGSSLRKAINEQRWEDVPREFAKWRMGGGRILPGLVRRRADEAAMFMKGVKAGAETVEAAPAPTPDPTPAPRPAPTWWQWLTRWRQP
jgi:lysozyme